MTTLLVLQHGILSDASAVQKIHEALKPLKPDYVHRPSYPWRDSVLETGIGLAQTIEELVRHEPELKGAGPCRIVFVGHSQGGLVCRVAAAALCDPMGLVLGIRRTQYPMDASRETELLGYLSQRDGASAQQHGLAVVGVAMMATPNDGAFTNGQLTIEARAFGMAGRPLLDRLGRRNYADLTTPQLFRVLQHARVKAVHYLTISGSSVNRFSRVAMDDLAQLPVLKRLAPHLDRPNDGVVEDRSVDLGSVTLPTEIGTLAGRYEHLRCYIDCDDVSHTNIHDAPNVLAALEERVRAWLQLPAVAGAPSPAVAASPVV
jgi:pimeloyl-ACP methyl ester carboxylesterase